MNTQSSQITSSVLSFSNLHFYNFPECLLSRSLSPKKKRPLSLYCMSSQSSLGSVLFQSSLLQISRMSPISFAHILCDLHFNECFLTSPIVRSVLFCPFLYVLTFWCINSSISRTLIMLDAILSMS